MASSKSLRSPTVKPEHTAPSEPIAQDQLNTATKFGEASTVFYSPVPVMGDVDIPSPSRPQVSPAVARQLRHRPPKRLSAVASSKVAPFSELPVNRPAFIPMSVWQSLSDEHRRELIDSFFPSHVSLAARHRASFDPVFTHF